MFSQKKDEGPIRFKSRGPRPPQQQHSCERTGPVSIEKYCADLENIGADLLSLRNQQHLKDILLCSITGVQIGKLKRKDTT